MENQKERGWILRILDKMYPDGLDRDIIKKQLVDLKFMTGEADIRGNITYLQEKGLVKLTEVGVGDLKRTVVTLTANGKDVIDKVVPTPIGVDI